MRLVVVMVVMVWHVVMVRGILGRAARMRRDHRAAAGVVARRNAAGAAHAPGVGHATAAAGVCKANNIQHYMHLNNKRVIQT